MKTYPVLLALASVLFISIQAYTEDVDLQKFIQETQKIERNDKAFKLVWWIPTEYWRESFKNNTGMSSEQKEEFYRSVDDYFVICLIDAKINSMGGITPATKDELIKSVSVTLNPGEKIHPLQDGEISADVKTFFSMMKPVITNMLGQFGQGMEFIFFRIKDRDGKNIIDPKKETSFTVNSGISSFRWRLPLGSLLPPKYDPDTGEKFPGSYYYNPYTGKKLMGR